MTSAAFKSRMSADSVDTIEQPVAVIPSSLNYSDYYVMDKRLRSRITFCTIPLGFLFRDDWPTPNSNEVLSKFHDNVVSLFDLREYKNGDMETREGMYQNLMDILWSIGNEGTNFDDEEVLEEVREFTLRYIRIISYYISIQF